MKLDCNTLLYMVRSWLTSWDRLNEMFLSGSEPFFDEGAFGSYMSQSWPAR